MIFVTVGTDEHDFSRLIKKTDEIISKIKERVIMQVGYTNYKPKNTNWFKFTTSTKIEDLYKKADIIITHGGAGSIINALKYGKMPLVVPRLKKFHEHVNDHQLDLTRALEKEGKIIAVYDLKDLENGLKKVKKIKHKPKNNLIVKTIKGFIEKIPS